MSMYSESYWKRREEADEARERGNTPPEPEVEVAESVAPLSSVDTASAVQTDDESAVAPPVPAPVAAPDPMKAERLRAIERIRQLGESEYEPPEGLRDSDIAAASSRDREQTRRDNFTEALAAAIARRPARMQSLPAEGGTLAQRRAQADALAQRKMGREMDANARIAAALKGDTKAPPALTPYQQAQLANAGTKRAYDEEQDRLRREQHGKERDEDLKFREDQARRADEAQKRHEALLALALRKEEKAEAADIPPGHEVVPGAQPSPDSRKKYTALVASQQKMKELTAAMRAELAGAGPMDRMMPGEKRRRLQQLATQLKIEGKNVAELGALSGPDMSLMDAMVTDPTTVGSLFGGNLSSNLAGMDAWADSAIRAGSKTYGIRPAGGGGGGQPSAIVPTDEKPPAGAIPPNAKNVRKRGKGWAYQMPDGSWEVWEP